MHSQIQKTLQVMKKAYDQPILFHVLHGHLAFLLLKTTPVYEMTDDWSKILIYSAHISKTPNQGLETKIQGLMKKLRPPLDCPEKKIKLMAICYYLLNRPLVLINHIIVFELVSNFLGTSDYFDGLIIKLLSNITTARVYGIDLSKKMRESSVNRMIEILKGKNLSVENRIKSLPCFIDSAIEPFTVGDAVIESNYLGYKHIEIFCLYAKYATNTSFIKNVLPDNVSFVEGLTDFMKRQFSFDCSADTNLDRCIVEDRSVFDAIRKSFELSNDKQRFVSDLVEFITGLK